MAERRYKTQFFSCSPISGIVATSVKTSGQSHLEHAMTHSEPRTEGQLVTDAVLRKRHATYTW